MRKITLSEYSLFMEAWFFLAVARLMLVIMPFKKIAPKLGEMVKTESLYEGKPANLVLLNKIKISILRACRFSPWRTKCFEQAIAAKIMLKKRKVTSTLYLGVFKGPANDLRAHAWLKFGDVIVTGGPITDQYTILSRFYS